MKTNPTQPRALMSFSRNLGLLTARFRCCLMLAMVTVLATLYAQADTIVGWGDNSNNQITPPPGLTDITAIAAGGGHNVAIRADGTIVTWGYNPFGQLNVPPGLNNVVGAAAGYDHSVVVRNNGTVVSWGRNLEGQTNVPPGLANVVAVGANGHHSLALTAAGGLVAWGDNGFNQNVIPSGLTDVVAISCGPSHNLALRADGTVVGWGRNDNGQATPPAGLTDVVAVAAGGEHSLALKSDGTVVGWGRNHLGQLDAALNPGNVVAIAAGFAHSMVLQANGQVIARGWNDYGQATVPSTLTGATAISAGFQHSLALVGQGGGEPPPTITCPPNVSVSCTNCNTDPAVTGTATGRGSSPVTITHSDSEAGTCPKVVTRTWTATDQANKTATCVQTITCRETDVGITITCPNDVVLTCANCNTDPAVTGTATGRSSSPVTITHSDSEAGTCPKVVTRTWTATDQANRTATCVQTITCRETVLTITCPNDVVLTCDNCNTDPSNTGTATATGNAHVAYTDVATGTCPKVVQRTWTATDDAGATASCVQRITCIPQNAVTDGSFRIFGDDFRLVFSQDPKNFPCYRLNDSNPSQFVYNVARNGTPGEQLTFNLTVPYPFVTLGTTPIRAYASVTVQTKDGKPSLVPANQFFSGSRRVSLSDHAAGSVTVPVTVRVPASGLVFLSLQLDYGLKRTSGYSRNLASDAVDCATGSQKMIPNSSPCLFSVSGAQEGSSVIQNSNSFKPNPGVSGVVKNRLTGAPVPGTTVTLATARGSVIGSRTTDEDGYFQIGYKHTGKATVYYVTIVTPADYRETKAVTLKSNKYVQLEFLTP